ncbi:hypothetical protein PVK06_035766 [Gossypium arboreum]|uniref:Uncharacterized protein n=1 Tax=Gossypium arboreum TaxID=29729 RepID=A0ABR0NI78_GOSAR|nr:hypothetical protein PVK06_035766 [Gossypium arboreum]
MANVANKVGDATSLLDDDDFELLEEDVRVSTDGPYPKIFFSKYVLEILVKSGSSGMSPVGIECKIHVIFEKPPSLQSMRHKKLDDSNKTFGIDCENKAPMEVVPDSLVETKGFLRGIWLLWSEKLVIDIVEVSNQLIHCQYTSQGMKQSVFFTIVYASLNVVKRRTLWNHFSLLAPEEEVP